MSSVSSNRRGCQSLRKEARRRLWRRCRAWRSSMGQAGGAAGGLRSLESMLAEGGTAAQLQPFLGQMLAASQLAGHGRGGPAGRRAAGGVPCRGHAPPAARRARRAARAAADLMPSYYSAIPHSCICQENVAPSYLGHCFAGLQECRPS